MPRDLSAVTLVDPRPAEWAARFAAIAGIVATTLAGARVEHIGSTAIPGLASKDVVDVLVGVAPAQVVNATGLLERAGMLRDGSTADHAWLWVEPKGHDGGGVVHVVAVDGPVWHSRILFREVLRRSPSARADYLAVKRSAAEGSPDWGSYTAAKRDIVARLLARAE
ncbi:MULTISPECIES: GrpB family protein [Microbacterium]|uniref:GrpB family protein n=1 Tax=Microbacterium TaxID=33882 RepID=UPI00199C0E4C|nr:MULTISPECIES: GrpB family protein [Microbacterium]MBD3756543.1 GrpB family protein [Microbacterium sp.]